MFTPEKLTKAIHLFSEKIQENRVYLTELDTPIGDGDHGSNMTRGMEAIMETELSGDCPDLFKKLAMTLISKVGGASGPLYGTAMMEMGKACKETLEPAPVLSAGIAGIQKRGKAAAGEKTMLDVWVPAVADAEKGVLTAEKLEEYVQSTKDMIATKGRASYVGERSRGHIDPGAMSSKYFFESLLTAGVFDDE